MGVVEFGLLWMSSVWLGWKIIRKFLFTLREDDPDENKESTLNKPVSRFRDVSIVVYILKILKLRFLH